MRTMMLQNRWLRVGGFSTLVLLAALPACYVLWSTLSTLWSIAFPSLYLDQWDNIAAFFAYKETGHTIDWLMSLHNEHQILIPRLLFLADWNWFGADNKFLLVWILMNQVVFLWLFSRILRATNWPCWVRAIAMLLSVVFLFSSTQLENLSWGFQVQFVNVYLFALLAFWSMANHIEQPSHRSLIATICFAFLAAFSMSNGMLVWPLLGLMCLFRVRWTTRILLVVAFAANLAIYLSGTRPPGEASALDVIGTLQKADFYRYIGIYLSNPLGKIGFTKAIAMTFMTVGLLALLSGVVCRQKMHRPEIKALIVSCFFVAGTAVFTALGRSRYGLIQATAERYTTPALLFIAWVALLACIVFAHPGTRHWVRGVILVWMGVLAVFGGFLIQKQWIYTIHYTNKNFKKLVALNAIQEGVSDRYHFGHLHPNLLGHRHTIENLKQHPKLKRAHEPDFLNPQTYPLPEGLSVEITQSHFLQTDQLLTKGKGWILYGGFKANRDLGRIPVLLMNEAGTKVGAGYLVHSFEPVWPLSEYSRMDGEQNFYLHIGVEELEQAYSLFAFLGKRWIPLGTIRADSVARPQSASLETPPTRKLKQASMVVMESDPLWTLGGAFPSAPNWDIEGKVYGSWSGNDALAGNIRVKITLEKPARALLLPIHSGPMNPNAVITLIDARSMQILHILRPESSPEKWAVLRIDVPIETREFFLIIAEEGRGWGQWLAFAPPLILP